LRRIRDELNADTEEWSKLIRATKRPAEVVAFPDKLGKPETWRREAVINAAVKKVSEQRRDLEAQRRREAIKALEARLLGRHDNDQTPE
jgi:hypothetical protein